MQSHKFIQPQSSITTLCIIRHGETDWNSSGRLQGTEDIELNEAGRQQAFGLAKYFENQSWDVIISSPLKRAFETASIIAAHLSFSAVEVVNELIERDYGMASGLFPEERHNLFPDGIIPQQEEFGDLRLRAMEAITRIVGKHQGKRIIVVSHGAFTNSILYSISGGEFGSFKTRLKNGCINQLIHSDQGWSVQFYNKTVDELSNNQDYV
jgi:uncharacterized phosphatase